MAHFLNSPKIISVRFDDIDAETLVLMLSEQGVYVSAGSACTSHSSLPSNTLKAIGLSDEQSRSTIRISFSAYNTIEEVENAAAIIVNCVIALHNITG